MSQLEVRVIDSNLALEFLLPRHYSGRKTNISYAFGWFLENTLKAVCTFGKPASPSLCYGICGADNAHSVYELNRLCRTEDIETPISKFVASCLNILKKEKDWIIVAYADTGMYHTGYVYQALNFFYTGLTKERTDKYTKGNRHSRHYDKNLPETHRKVRTAKHRYVYFCTRHKYLKKRWLNSMNYIIQDYPKNENKNYELGTFQKPIIIEVI